MKIGKYFYLTQELEHTNFRVNLELRDFNKNKPNEYLKYKSIYDEQFSELELLCNDFSIQSSDAENLRFEMIRVLNGSLSKIDRIIQMGYYPDLDQAWAIKGHVFGKVQESLINILKYEGGVGQIPKIYMSRDKWDYTILLDALNKAKKLLENSKFYSLSNALYYHHEIQSYMLINRKKAIGYMN